MDIYNKFEHFISYFLPGIVLSFVVLADMSIFLHKNLVLAFYNSKNFIPVIIIAASIFGIILDGFRHVFIDSEIEKLWSDKNQQKSADELLCTNTTLYNQLVSDYFYYYEFSLNLLLVIILMIVSFPFFIISFQISINLFFLTFLTVSCIVLFYTLYLFAQESFQDFNSICSNIINKKKK